MKNLLCSLLIIASFCSCLFAQQGNTGGTEKTSTAFVEDKTVKNEMGFDMFYFLNLFRQNFESTSSSIFAVAYNRDLSDKISLRTSLGLGYTNLNYKADSVPSLKTKVVEENFKIGIAWQKEVFRRWQFYYGVDIECQHGHNEQQQLTQYKNNFSNYINNIFILGPGPFLGLVFYINPRLSVNIESNLNFVYSNTTVKTVNADHPELNSTITTKGITTTFILPQNVFLNIKF